VVAEAASDSTRAKLHFKAAAESILAERTRGVNILLAPDRRSLVAFSGAFNMGAGYSSESPFGLTIDVSVTTRMALFPPAAVDKKKLEPHLKETHLGTNSSIAVWRSLS